MHVHMHIGFDMKKRTSLGQPPRAAEWPVTAASGVTAHPRTHTVEPQLLAATGGSLGSPVWVEVGGERVNGCRAAALMSVLRRPCGSLNACGNVVSGRTRATDGILMQ